MFCHQATDKNYDNNRCRRGNNKLMGCSTPLIGCRSMDHILSFMFFLQHLVMKPHAYLARSDPSGPHATIDASVSTSSSNARNRLQVARVFVKDDVNNCDSDVPAKERTCRKLTNPDRRFWYCNNSLKRPRKCDYYEWKDVALEDGYYKNLIYSMMQQLDSKEDLGVIKNLMTRNTELEFLLSKEKSLVATMEKGMCDSKKSIRMYKLLVVVLVVGYVCFVFKLAN
ncbi:unnamed protein product [Lactuca virosa]|uniref:Zinc finger GRF-type domain-containing protein n=1 Tax=Lactuca virosa TaxID=75947 RepID=A0AAU9ME13_9ASTR|nr:unnamed protein product [Lactuca virosa]